MYSSAHVSYSFHSLPLLLPLPFCRCKLRLFRNTDSLMNGAEMWWCACCAGVYIMRGVSAGEKLWIRHVVPWGSIASRQTTGLSKPTGGKGRWRTRLVRRTGGPPHRCFVFLFLIRAHVYVFLSFFIIDFLSVSHPVSSAYRATVDIDLQLYVVFLRAPFFTRHEGGFRSGDLT